MLPHPTLSSTISTEPTTSFAIPTLPPPPPIPSNPIRSSTRIPRPQVHTNSTIPFPPKAHLTTIISNEPTCFTEASKHPQWCEAMDNGFSKPNLTWKAPLSAAKPGWWPRAIANLRAWFSKLSDSLSRLGFYPSKSDSSLFIFTSGSSHAYVLIYVDDIILITSHPTLDDQFITTLSSDFPLKDLGSLHYILGVEVIPTPSDLLLNQNKYISDLFK
ncbi:hypothetical protein V2J09_012972 [Rumex salicifolius]